MRSEIRRLLEDVTISKIGLRAPAFLREKHSNTAACQLLLAWQLETSSNGAVDGEYKRACRCGCDSALIIAIFIDGRGFGRGFVSFPIPLFLSFS